MVAKEGENRLEKREQVRGKKAREEERMKGKSERGRIKKRRSLGKR